MRSWAIHQGYLAATVRLVRFELGEASNEVGMFSAPIDREWLTDEDHAAAMARLREYLTREERKAA